MNYAYLLLLLRGISNAFGQVNDKFILSKLGLDKIFAAFFRVFFSFLALLIPLYFMGEYHHLLNLKFIGYTLANVSGNIICVMLWYSLIKKFDISYIATIKTTQPFIFAIISFFILGEALGPLAILGLLFILIGSFILEKSRLKEKEKFNLFKSGWPLVLLNIVIAGIITNFSKMAILEASPLIYIWLRYSLMSIVFYTIYKFKFSKKRVIKKGLKKFNKKHILPASLSGVFLLISAICEMHALKVLPIAVVEAISKFDLIVLLLLEYIFITRYMNIKRIISSLIIIAGVFLLIYS